MEWWAILSLMFLGMVVLFLLGVPIAFSFLCINIVCFYLFIGGAGGIDQLILSMQISVMSFVLLPVPLFVLMGEIMYQSGIAPNMLDALNKLLGRIPGRLCLLAVAGGTLFATLSGSSMAATAMLGSLLVPDMLKSGYKKEMSVGPIMASGGLAVMIPPSIIGVVCAALGDFSVGHFLIAIIIPGLMMASLYAAYIIIRCRIQPDLAPSYDHAHASWSETMVSVLRYILPLSSILFLVVGLVFLGIATPSEAAAVGCVGCFVLAFAYRRFNWIVFKKSMAGTIRISGMLLMIMVGCVGFSQILAFTGATSGLVEMTTKFPLPPIFIIILMLIVLLIMGTFMEAITIMMITMPIYMPIIRSFGFEPLWFGVLFLVSIETGGVTPPFGLLIFILKGVIPDSPNISMGDLYRAGIPFILCNAIVITLILLFPFLATWLPGLML